MTVSRKQSSLRESSARGTSGILRSPASRHRRQLVPIVMVVLTLTLKYPIIRWVNIIVAIIVIVFNLLGLPYKGAYDNFLIVASFVFNALTIWYAWKWIA